ncbi:MAG: DUF6444 domain-containing protein, partial [Firmicutes bacterium]|nr:DUF6444 domain-containing protein [Bacillota bacterium]
MRKPLDIEKVKEVLASEEIRKDSSPAVLALTGIVFALLEEIVELRKENEELRRENEALRAENTMLKEKVRELEIRLNKDSSNSGKPPSSDGLKKPPAQRSLRERSGRRPGGQPGRKGITLQFSENPDRIIEHPVETCNQCGLSLKDTAPDKI